MSASTPPKQKTKKQKKGRVLQPAYGKRVALHESGHFLVAYLVGLLPRAYTLTALDAWRRYGALNVQAGCTFCDAAFEAEVASGRLAAASLDKFACVALAGMVRVVVFLSGCVFGDVI